MPISIMSAPAFGNALMMSSEVAGSGSPAITKEMKAERPCFPSSLKRVSRRVVMMQYPRGRALPRQLHPGSRPRPNSPWTRRKPPSLLPPQDIRHLWNVLVAATGEIDHHQMILGPLWRELHGFGNGVRGLQRRNDAFQPREQLKRGERLVI